MRSGFTAPSTYVLAAVAVILAIVASLTGPRVQRSIAGEVPLMGWHFVGGRALPSLALPLIAGRLVAVFRPD